MSHESSIITLTMKVGDVFQIPLPDGRFAYGRIYRDASVGIYRKVSEKPNNPPLGSRDFLFIVGMYRDVPYSNNWPNVGKDPFPTIESEWPPPMFVKDVISGSYQIYHRGTFRDADRSEVSDLEEAAVWDSDHIIDRIVRELEKEELLN